MVVKPDPTFQDNTALSNPIQVENKSSLTASYFY